MLQYALNSIQDSHFDYYIMRMEGLLTFPTIEEEVIPLEQKMQKVYEKCDFNYYREMYQTDINKKKMLLLESIRQVCSMQVGELLILKYEMDISFDDLWNEFYKECRGVIINLESLELVSSPYHKFFNLNENPSTSLERILTLLNEAEDILIKNKEDGSMVSVTKYRGKVIIATTGALESEQAKWARKFLYKHYRGFIEDMPEYITFIFEAIYPENRIVVNYRDEEKMVLTSMRSTKDGSYYSDGVVQLFGLTYHFPTPKEEKKSFTLLLDEAKNRNLHPADKKEGWVITIKSQTKETMFKLKCEDYCEIHRLYGVVSSPKIVFKHVIHNTFDDFISKVPDSVKPQVLDIANVIRGHIKSVKIELKQVLNTITKDILFTQEEIENKLKVKRIIKEKIVPIIDTKLSKTIRSELEEALLAKVFKKEPYVDKYIEKEFQRLWSMIPSNLQNQRDFNRKEGKLLGFVYNNIPETYQSIALDYARGFDVDYLSCLEFKDIDFGFLKKKKED